MIRASWNGGYMKNTKKQTVTVAVEQKNGVVQRISKATIVQPVIRFNGGAVKWYEDKKRK